MNHPFPANLPVLRDIYAGRFAQVLFLMPFERMADPDVITVYRGSYAHAAYLTDASASLASIECDYYMVVHDDVMLNPRLSEQTFSDYFPLASGNGYISKADSPSRNIGTRAWYYSSLPRLLYPKSMLLGSGVDPVNVTKYLPPADEMRRKMDVAGIAYQNEVVLDTTDFADVKRHASRVLLNGHVAATETGSVQTDIEARSLALEQQLVEVMALDQATAHPGSTAGRAQLPFPILDAGCHADFYILPKAKFSEFVHYIGVAAASGVFVEIAVPVLLYAVCDRVWTADELNLEVAFFNERNSLLNFIEPRLLAIHPFKLSAYSDADSRRTLMWMLTELAEGRAPGPPEAVEGPYPFNDLVEAAGWHRPEAWGRWSGRSVASLDFYFRSGAVQGLKLRLLAPMHLDAAAFLGEVRLNGTQAALIAITAERPQVTVELDASRFAPNAVNRVEVLTGEMVSPRALNPTSNDGRALGLGLTECAFY